MGGAILGARRRRGLQPLGTPLTPPHPYFLPLGPVLHSPNPAQATPPPLGKGRRNRPRVHASQHLHPGWPHWELSLPRQGPHQGPGTPSCSDLGQPRAAPTPHPAAGNSQSTAPLHSLFLAWGKSSTGTGWDWHCQHLPGLTTPPPGSVPVTRVRWPPAWLREGCP